MNTGHSYPRLPRPVFLVFYISRMCQMLPDTRYISRLETTTFASENEIHHTEKYCSIDEMYVYLKLHLEL